MHGGKARGLQVVEESAYKRGNDSSVSARAVIGEEEEMSSE